MASTVSVLSAGDFVIGRPKGFDRANALVAFFVWLGTLLVYLATKAPTVTFWDCGEFIAVSQILGIPHPPGTPLFVMIGRLASFVPFFSDPAARINFLSSLCSSLAALFGYLSAVRILRYWFGEDQSVFSRFLIYAGAASGAFFLAFSFTQWGNAIEAEVYGMAMLLFLTILWLTLIYYDMAESRGRTAVLLLIVYLSFLSIGVHMATFVIFPISSLFLILKKETPVRYWFVAAAVFAFELYLIFALSSLPDEIPYYVPVVVMFVLYLLYAFSVEKSGALMMYFVIGYLVAIAPIYGVIRELITNPAGAAASGTPASPALNIIGIAGFCGLVLYALYVFVKSRGIRPDAQPADRSLVVSSLFVLVTAVMVLLLVANVRGYAVFLILSILLLIGLGMFLWQYIRFSIFLAVAAAGLIILGFYQFLFGLIGVTLLLLVLGLGFRLPEWRTGILIVVMAAAGMSVHAYLPIRSSQNPEIDQTHTAESFKTTVSFIERKQYGSEAMTSRMFHRRGEWENQFGMYQRMGFWRFFSVQYGLKGARFFVLFILGVLGMWEAVRRRSEAGLLLTLLVVLCSIGLVLYMNFADGQRMTTSGGDYIEVRDRDYFFTPAFMLFGLAIGIGISALLQTVREGLSRMSAQPRMVILASGSVLFLLPVFAVAGNYREIDRSNNYIAYDYAYNLLESADKGAVLFTYGDNDTFPLWALQEAFGVRRDVKIVNLSLATTKWYIKQVQNQMKVDLGWTDADIDALHPYRTPDGLVFGLESQVVDAAIEHGFPHRPINFATSVPEGARKYQGRPVAPYLLLEGFQYRFTGVKDKQKVDVDGSMAFLMDSTRFRTRGLNDPRVFKDDNMTRLCGAYTTTFLVVADSLRKAKRYADAEKLLKYGRARLLPDDDMTNLLASVYVQEGRPDKVDSMLVHGEVKDPRWLNLMLARSARDAGDTTAAETAYLEMLRKDPTYRLPLEDLARIYNEQMKYGKLRALFQDWLSVNPKDKDIQSLLQQLDEFTKHLKRDTAKAK